MKLIRIRRCLVDSFGQAPQLELVVAGTSLFASLEIILWYPGVSNRAWFPGQCKDDGVHVDAEVQKLERSRGQISKAQQT